MGQKRLGYSISSSNKFVRLLTSNRLTIEQYERGEHVQVSLQELWQGKYPMSHDIPTLLMVVWSWLRHLLRLEENPTKRMEAVMNLLNEFNPNWRRNILPSPCPRTYVPRVINRRKRLHRHTITIYFKNEPRQFDFEVSCRESRCRNGFIVVYRLI